MKNYLRESSHWFLQDGQDPPHHDRHAHQSSRAPEGREGGHHRAGEPGPGRLRKLDPRGILNKKKKIKINLF